MRGRELPGFPKPAVLTFLVGEYVKHWEKQILNLLQATEELAQEAAGAIVDHHTTGYSLLGSMLKSGLADLVQEGRAETRRVLLEQVLANEREPMTLNHYLMDTYNKQRQAGVEDQRRADITAALDRFIALAISEKTPPGATELERLKAWVLATSLLVRTGESNETQEAEQLGAMLVAYWKTSCKRFIDTAVQNIDGGLLRRMGEECTSSMLRVVEGGGAEGGAERLVEILAEDRQVRELRLRIEARLKRLNAAKDHILEAAPGIQPVRRLAASGRRKQPDDASRGE
jgi:hypothetical protein